jgi:23S rRNA pseudouridine1911/1915/1917 synthase
MDKHSAARRGEWLEIPLHLSKSESLEECLLKNYFIPQKLIDKLKQNNGVRTKTESVLLRLFPCESDDYIAEWAELEVLFEDDFCLVVNKPAGMAVHPAHAGRTGTLANAVASYYQTTGQSCKIRHIHRLDEHTTGAVLYAKNELAQIHLDEQMRMKSIHRQYAAFAEGLVQPNKGRIDAPIGRDRHHPNRRRVSSTGDTAVTHYEVIETFNDASLLNLRLETGRTHQIRVHLSHLRHPLIGDAVYGGKTKRLSRQALHGEVLSFSHPFFGDALDIHAPWPNDLLNLLSELRLSIP